MKLLMFGDGGTPRLGVGRDGAPDEIVDVAAAANGAGSAPLPATVLSVIDAGEEGVDRLRILASSAPSSAIRKLADLTLLPPFDPPRGNVLAIGRNYQKHAEETARASNAEVGPPTIFTKAITTIAAPYADIRIDASVSTKIDWEVELGVVAPTSSGRTRSATSSATRCSTTSPRATSRTAGAASGSRVRASTDPAPSARGY
jgi:2-keto-4-pentenoate hydratase/2-oxohepta-3-ene-1,7-dioic acid hydratase in catechol pathway